MMTGTKRRRSDDENKVKHEVEEVEDGNEVNDNSFLLQDVFRALSCDVSKSVFAIGGTINLCTSQSNTSADQRHVAIRWDSKDGHGHKISLPVGNHAASCAAFRQLLNDCQPATFGKGKEDVLDETYRKAGKMDVTDFCTDFNLSEHGIMETVVQALGQRGSTNNNHYGVRAELYKLNVYSAPSGVFRAHVDTPRSNTQMGSLVVCLPYVHKGGALLVRHGNQQVQFDWSEMPDSIQWAAFFSDCEHEVLQVSEGHRVTLTYNLYWTDYGPSLMAGHLDALDQSSLHFYAALERLIDCPSFLPNGGLIGFACIHGYPHTSRSAIPQLNHALKGLDMLVYQALKCLTGSAEVCAALDGSRYEEECDDHGYYQSDSETSSTDARGDFLASKSYLTKFLFDPRIHGEYEDEQLLDPESIKHHVVYADGTGRWELAFPRQKIIWLNGSPRSFHELAVAFIAYGNSASVDAYYSTAVIVSEVQAYSIRTKVD